MKRFLRQIPRLVSMVILNPIVFVRVPIAVRKKKHDQCNFSRKGFIWLMIPYHCSSQNEVMTGTQNSNLDAGADAETENGRVIQRPQREGCRLAYHSLLNLLSYRAQG